MVDFIVYDLFLLVIFAIAVSIFLYKNRINLKREGLLFLYKAGWGIKLINLVGKKYRRTLNILSYISIGLGYILMTTMLYLLGKIIAIYFFRQDIVQQIKIPPIMPLVPYIDKIAPNLGLPTFNFTYWIIILAIIAISHEFAHGIFAAYNKIKIKSTGFGFFPFFLPVFLAAFVELDEKKMVKHKKIQQMAILSAGTFANVLVAVFFTIIFWLFFMVAFTPAGVVYDDYAQAVIPVENITSVNNIQLKNSNYEVVLEILNGSSLGEIQSDYGKFYGVKAFSSDGSLVQVYYDAPAIKNNLNGIITKINHIPVTNKEILAEELGKYSPGESIFVGTISEGEEARQEITLEANPENPEKAWIGIVFIQKQSSGIFGKLSAVIMKFKDPNIYYQPRVDGLSLFIYNLLWWLILISISVALVNMLPVGIFDGGRFFYLTILGITGREKIARKSFAFVTYLFLILVAALMFFWIWSFF